MGLNDASANSITDSPAGQVPSDGTGASELLTPSTSPAIDSPQESASSIRTWTLSSLPSAAATQRHSNG